MTPICLKYCAAEQEYFASVYGLRPHRLWLALLATRLSRELDKSLNGKLQRAGEFNTRARLGKRAAKVLKEERHGVSCHSG